MGIIKDYQEFFFFFLLEKGQHVIVHSSFRSIRRAFPGSKIEEMLEALKKVITKEGSIIMPAFTYCYKKIGEDYNVFERENTASEVGAVSEVFRKSDDVIRTSSPTHSFSLWGKVTEDIGPNNAPKSPLGKNSPLDWLNKQDNSYVLLLGIGFTTLSFCHYLEVKADVPWSDVSPWDYLSVEKIGVSKDGEQELKDVPGCSKSFKNFEKYLLNREIIEPFNYQGLSGYFISIEILYKHGMDYFQEHPDKLLCPRETCEPCDTRRNKLNIDI